jgi:hypothetical protein
MADLHQWAHDLGYVAAELRADGHRYADGIHRAAKVFLELAETLDPDTRTCDPDGCPGCGTTVTQPATGRRRTWCSEACRSRHRRR